MGRDDGTVKGIWRGGMREEDDAVRTVDSWMFSPSAVSRIRHVKGCIKRTALPHA